MRICWKPRWNNGRVRVTIGLADSFLGLVMQSCMMNEAAAAQLLDRLESTREENDRVARQLGQYAPPGTDFTSPEAVAQYCEQLEAALRELHDSVIPALGDQVRDPSAATNGGDNEAHHRRAELTEELESLDAYLAVLEQQQAERDIVAEATQVLEQKAAVEAELEGLLRSTKSSPAGASANNKAPVPPHCQRAAEEWVARWTDAVLDSADERTLRVSSAAVVDGGSGFLPPPGPEDVGLCEQQALQAHSAPVQPKKSAASVLDDLFA